MLITFEGGEGCGKSTHSKLLKEYLVNKRYKVIRTLEPGGTEIGKKLRHVLLKGRLLLSKYSELLLFSADRAEHVARIIRPALKACKIVISDRFVDSTTAYQVGGRKLPGNLVAQIHRISSGGIMPDLTFLLDISPDAGISRGTKRSKKDKFESENNKFHQRVRKAYLKIAKLEPGRVKVISTERSVAEVQNMIRRITDEKLGNKK
ncbi:MAG: dTMP kinase [Candidatus Saganbacteria bacterium]|nr:dTMP kinase [Candidatus Saganbacteria bacterium]